MDIEHRIEKDICFLSLSGNLISTQLSDIKEYANPLFDNASIKEIIINMSDVPFIDSQGIGWLVLVLKNFKPKNKTLALCNLNEKVLNVLKSTHLDKVFSIYSTEEEAFNTLT